MSLVSPLSQLEISELIRKTLENPPVSGYWIVRDRFSGCSVVMRKPPKQWDEHWICEMHGPFHGGMDHAADKRLQIENQLMPRSKE